MKEKWLGLLLQKKQNQGGHARRPHFSNGEGNHISIGDWVVATTNSKFDHDQRDGVAIKKWVIIDDIQKQVRAHSNLLERNHDCKSGKGQREPDSKTRASSS